AFGNLRIAQIGIEFGADEIVVVPEDRIAFLGAPLVIAEHHHGDPRPFLAANRAHLVHRDAERSVTGETDAGRVGIADLGSDDRRKSIAARSEQARRQIFAALLEGWIGVADRAVVADIAGDDGVARQTGLNRAPGLARRHPLLVALACVLVPGRARIVFLMIHA